MSCINKSHPTYKRVVESFGPVVTDSLIRCYSRDVKKLSETELYYPNLTEIKGWLNTSKSEIIRNVSIALSLDPFTPEAGLKSLLTGVVNNFEGQNYITKGNTNTGSLVGNIDAINTIFEPNYMIMKELVRMYPNRFEIINTQYKYVKIVKFKNENLLFPSTDEKIVTQKISLKPDPEARLKYFSSGENQKLSIILQKIGKSTHPLAKLSNKLIEFANINDINIEIHPVKKFLMPSGDVEFSKGYYDPKTNVIKIAEFTDVRNGQVETLLLHEILHALSWHALRRDGQVKDNFNKLYENAVEKLGKFNPKTAEGQYGTYTIDEFFVALFTDANFIKTLEKLKPVDGIKYSNVLQEIFDFIANLLKISTNDDTLYAQAFAVATNILEAENEYLAPGYPADVIEYNGNIIPESININEEYIQNKYNSKIRTQPIDEFTTEVINYINNMRNFGYTDPEIDDQLNCL